MIDLEDYYVLKLQKKNESEWVYLETLYANSISIDESIDDAIKFPESVTPKQLGEYIIWRKDNSYLKYKVFNVKTIMEEVEL